MTENLTLMAIFAHPDDEAFGTGGTLAKYAAEGVEVHLVTATLGEAGRVANLALSVTRPLGPWREHPRAKNGRLFIAPNRCRY